MRKQEASLTSVHSCCLVSRGGELEGVELAGVETLLSPLVLSFLSRPLLYSVLGKAGVESHSKIENCGVCHSSPFQARLWLLDALSSSCLWLSMTPDSCLNIWVVSPTT